MKHPAPPPVDQPTAYPYHPRWCWCGMCPSDIVDDIIKNKRDNTPVEDVRDSGHP